MWVARFRPKYRSARVCTALTCACTAARRLTLPACKRLRRKADFEATYGQGRRFGNGFFGVTARSNDRGLPRLGLAVAVRVAGNAVKRNRLRRLIRESFRLYQHELPALDLVVSARPRARDAQAAELRRSLSELWKSIAAKCGS